MFPRWIVNVLCTLWLVSLVSSKTVRDAECQNYVLRLINEYFKRTSIVRGDATDVKYCETSAQYLRPQIDLNQVIELYQSLENVNTYVNHFNHTPITSYGVIDTDQADLPLYLTADIRKHHLPGQNSYLGLGNDVKQQMELMGQMDTDDYGYLLPHSLGRASRAFNIVPIARNVNRHLSLVPDSVTLGVPRSNWKANEDWIRRFLMWDYPYGRMDWKLAVQYQDDVIKAGSSCGYRPVSFSLQFTAYTNQYDNTSLYYASPQITYFNDNDYLCGPGESHFRPRREVNLQLKCDVHEPSSSKGIIGSQLSKGQWDNVQTISTPFSIQGRTFFYGHATSIYGNFWYIQEVLANGQMGSEVAKEPWTGSPVVVAFAFFMDGKQYLYRHSEDRKWSVHELLPYGGIGREADKGGWNKLYTVSFPFTISGKHYFYAGSKDNITYFIRELLPGGIMDRKAEEGYWTVHYDLAVPLTLNGRKFFYAHSISDKSWCVKELLPGGKIGGETDRGIWKTRHQVSVPYSMEGKQYFFAQSIIDGAHWFIQEPLANGKIGEESSQGVWSDNYPIVFTYSMKGKHYLYGHSHITRNWFIKELL